jgi:hypothetical protein
MKRSFKVISVVFTFFLLAAPSYFFSQVKADSESPPPSIPGVQVQVVDTLGNIPLVSVCSSFALDSAGNPHVAYSDGKTVGVKYAWWNGTGWNIQVVDTVGDDMSINLALDSKANPYITYRYLDSHGVAYLKYAHWDGAAWKIQTIGVGGDYSSIVVDSKDNPHIAYYGQMSLRYASWNGERWVIQTVESGGAQAVDGSYNSTGWWVSLKLDANDNPHMSYYRYTNFESNGEIKYASWNGVNWNIEHVSTIVASDQYTYTSLALDSNGNPQIAYRGDTGLMYAVSDGSNWSTQTIDYSFKPAYNIGAESLVLDPNDNPYISYVDSYRFSVLKLAFLNGSTWQINTLTPAFHGGYSTSIAMDSSGNIHICRDDLGTLTLNYITINPAQLPPPTPLADPPLKLAVWPPQNTLASPAGNIQSVDAPEAGAYTSLVLDAAGNPYISYFDRFGYQLRFAYCNDSKVWHASTVDADGWVGFYSSLALSINGTPHISYLDESGNKLKYAQWNGSTWNTQTVDTIGNRYSYTSLALDDNGYPHISYFDGANCTLKYASWNGFNWTIQTVDASGFTGEYSSLKLDSAGSPHISYYDASVHGLKYAVWTGNDWVIQTIDSNGNVGFSTSLALDTQGNPHISYYDVGNDKIKYAYFNGLGWNTQTVANSKYGDYVRFFNSSLDYTSLALDSKNTPFITYADGGSRNLKLAFLNGTSWIIQTVDSTFDSGWTSALAIDSNDKVHISYYEGWHIGHLMYVASADNSSFFAKPAPLSNNSSPTPTPTPDSSSTSTSSVQDNSTKTMVQTSSYTQASQTSEPNSYTPSESDGTGDNGKQQDDRNWIAPGPFPLFETTVASVVAFSVCISLILFLKRWE